MRVPHLPPSTVRRCRGPPMRERDPAPPQSIGQSQPRFPPFPVVGLRVGQGIPLLHNTTFLPRDAANFSTADAFVMTGCRV